MVRNSLISRLVRNDATGARGGNENLINCTGTALGITNARQTLIETWVNVICTTWRSLCEVNIET